MSDEKRRPSIRQSLGKALENVMSKENVKRSTRIHHPRTSAALERTPANATTSDPAPKIITRKRVSGAIARTSSEEGASSVRSPSEASVSSRLRPRPTSALPKYRPKSAVSPSEMPEKPPSPQPVRVGTRRRLSDSEDDKKEQKRPESGPKDSRPISPLPQRAALKSTTNHAQATPPATPTKQKSLPSTPGSSSRPAKLLKIGIPRPSSAASAHAATTPKNSAPTTKVAPGSDKQLTPLGRSPLMPSRDTPSPLATRSKRPSRMAPSSSVSSSNPGSMTNIAEHEDDDGEEADVELLLAPVAPRSAPTPSMPRIQMKRAKGSVPSRPSMSSYAPPKPTVTTPVGKGKGSLRPPNPHSAGRGAVRGSILSWEQLADDSFTLDQEEITKMLGGVSPPFTPSVLASPALSAMEIPESPCLSAMDSPSGYGSISQVLLPDVTPSPAMHTSQLTSRFSLTPSEAAYGANASNIANLRLQLVACEQQVQERDFQIESLEEEMRSIKAANDRQREEAERQLAWAESQARAVAEEKQSRIYALEEMLEDASKSATTATNAQRIQKRRFEVALAAKSVSRDWEAAKVCAEDERVALEAEKALLAALLSQMEVLKVSLGL